MTPAVSPVFVVGFSTFVVATLVLVFLTLRFTFRRAAADRATWLARQAGERDGKDTGGDDDGDGEEDDEDGDPGWTALVLAGGGTRGAVQIGMLQVLSEHGFRPDRIYGTSVGAINGVGFAGNPTPSGVTQMGDIWRELTADTVYPQGRLHGPWMYIQQRDAVYANSGLRGVLEASFPFERLEETVIPVEVVATSLADGREHWFTAGPAVPIVLASTAIPAIYPPVEIDGGLFIDGGVVDNVPIRRAIDAGATRVVVLLCSPPTFAPPVARRPAEAMVNALFISIHSRFARDMADVPDHVEVILCIGGESSSRNFDDFDNTEALIEEGRREAEDVVRRYRLGFPSMSSDDPATACPDTQPSPST